MKIKKNKEEIPQTRDSQKRMPIYKLILVDVLLVGLILVVFAMFHHVIPAFKVKYHRWQKEQTAAVSEPSSPTESPATTPETVPPTDAPEDHRTEWQKKFAEHFTDTVVTTDHSYTSPNVSVNIETVTTGEGSDQITYHVADVYVASLDNFVTATAYGEMEYFSTQDVLEMDADANGILSVSGDFLTYQVSGFLMRNEEIYVSDTNFNSICVLYDDGVIETYDGGEYTIDEILQRHPLQVWSFGPKLLDENGKVRDSYQVSTTVGYPNPRSAIGYYEPGHYCFVVVDGRQPGYSAGMTIPQLAAVFEQLGCTTAYNLDGGGSAVMVFDDQRYSKPSNGGDRALGDILVIRESKEGA